MRPCGGCRVAQKRGLQAVYRFHTIPDCLQSVSDETAQTCLCGMEEENEFIRIKASGWFQAER